MSTISYTFVNGSIVISKDHIFYNLGQVNGPNECFDNIMKLIKILFDQLENYGVRKHVINKKYIKMGDM